MNIMMIGHARSGKTAFMAALYKYLGDSNSGYGVHAVDGQQRAKLQSMASDLSKGIYPKSTDVQSQYNFTFTIEGDEVMPFKWLDYRGGLLTSPNPTDLEKEEFVDALKYADALIVFLDGQKLSDSSNRWHGEYSLLVSCIHTAIRKKNEGIFPICFVVTKCDLDGDINHGLSYFTPYFKQIESADHVEAIVMRSVVDKVHYIDPFKALCYCIRRGFSSYEKRRKEALKDAENRLRIHKTRGVIDFLFNVVETMCEEVAEAFGGGWDTEFDLENMAENDIRKEKRKLELLETVKGDLDRKIHTWHELKWFEKY